MKKFFEYGKHMTDIKIDRIEEEEEEETREWNVFSETPSFCAEDEEIYQTRSEED